MTAQIRGCLVPVGIPGGAVRLSQIASRLGSSAMQTGFPLADARDDFERARRRARWARLADLLRGRPTRGNRLEVLAQTAAVAAGTGSGATGRGGPRVGRVGPMDQASVPIDCIIG